MNLGLITLHWSYIETCLDALVAITYHQHGGNKIDNKLPRMLGPKLKYLRRVFRKAPRLAEQQSEAAAYFDQVESLSERRHVLIHGWASEFPPDGIKFVKLRVEQHFHHVEEHYVGARDLLSFSGETGELALKLAEFIKPFTAQLLQELGKEAGREVSA